MNRSVALDSGSSNRLAIVPYDAHACVDMVQGEYAQA